MATSLLSPTIITLLLLLALVLNLDLTVSSRTLNSCRSCKARGGLFARHHYSAVVTESTTTISGTRYGSITSFDSPLVTRSTPTIMGNRYKSVTSSEKINAQRLPPIDSAESIVSNKTLKIVDFYVNRSKCDENGTYNNEDLVVALSTGWYNGGSRCLKNIKLEGNGKSVIAKVIGEYDSVNNVVVASPAVREALDIIDTGVGDNTIKWNDV